jgi:uncharacterized protein YndB with AHSA1/START domain
MADNVERELTLVREYDAPRDLVFKAWTDNELVAKWWGPNGFTAPVTELDVRPGGAIDIVMEDAEGMIEKGSRYPMTGTFQEVVEPEKLVFTSSPIMNDKPIMDTTVTVTFDDIDGKTKLTVHIAVTRTTPEAEMPLKGMEMGWSQQLDRLPALLKVLQ